MLGRTGRFAALFAAVVVTSCFGCLSRCLAVDPASDQVRAILSSEDATYRLTEIEPISLSENRSTSGVLIEVHLEKPRQSMLGMGASLEHATCENLWKLPEDLRDEVVTKLVDPEVGVGMNLMRVCIGTSDFVGEPYYTYDDLPKGETDPELIRFSIEKDRKYVLPTIRMALRWNPHLLIFASPWSPPAWMKDSGELGGGSVLPEFYPAYARYLVKFVQAYEAEGVSIHAITVQNEPQHADRRYPTTRWSAAQQRDFIRDHLGPLFQRHRLRTEIWCWDHNWNQAEFPAEILKDPRAERYVSGTAFHLYEGQVEAQSQLHDQFPEKPVYFTEGSVFGTRGAMQLADILRHWSRSYNGWVVMLDEHRRPNQGPHLASPTCIELLDDGSVRYNFDYFMMGQFMKYIERDAVCVESTTPDLSSIGNIAFINPDGRKVLVVVNSSRRPQPITVQAGSRRFTAVMPAASVATYLWE